MGPWQCKIAAPYALYDALHPQPRGNPILNAIAELNDLSDRSLLIVEDDKPFLERLSRAMETRGFAVTSCDTVTDGLAQINKAAPAFAVVDLRLGDGNGLDVVSALKRKRPDARTIVLTGYGNIATAVTAVKMRAVGIGDDQAGILREYLAGQILREGEEQPVAMHPVVLPFLIGA